MKLETATSSLLCELHQSTALDLATESRGLAAIATVEPPQPEADNPSESLPSAEQRSPSAGAVFGSTFLTIFLAELGDKTQLATLLMSAESQSPWIVFLGSAAALITTSLFGVLLGQWLATRLTPKTLRKTAGVCLLLISLMLMWDVLQF